MIWAVDLVGGGVGAPKERSVEVQGLVEKCCNVGRVFRGIEDLLDKGLSAA